MSQANGFSGEPSSYSQRNQCQPPRLPHRRMNWHHPIVGYLMVFPILALTLLLTLAIQSIVPDFIMHNGVLVLAVSFIALFWGKGPTILALILGIILLDFLVIPSIGVMTMHHWPYFIQVLPYLLSGLLIAEITRQRQRHQQHLELAINTLRQHAQELETLNVSLQATNQAKDQELETLNASLQATNQAKDQQLAMAAHELKNPLTALQLYTQWLQRQGTSSLSKSIRSERLTTAYQKIEEQTQRLGTLIEELLNRQLTPSPQKPPPSQHCDLAVLCDHIVEHYRFTTGRSLTLSTSSASLRVPGHSHHLEQVLHNLITNAIKYSPEGSCVEVALHQKNGMARLSINNTGPAIASDQLSLLFTPYYRTPEAQSSSVAGQGLGLAIVRTLVEQYHGQVWCESTLREGVTFIAELPLLYEP